jgi:uncharacterized caspase-like protein
MLTRFSKTLSALVFAAVLLTAPFSRAEAGRPDCYVLSVGVDRYRAADVPDLEGCVQDAASIAEVFQGQQGSLFGTVRVKSLVDAHATRAGIENGIGWLRRSGKGGDYVILFVSGHGGASPQGWAFFPHDFDRKDAEATSLHGVRILALADTLAREGKKVFLVVDACFAGQLRGGAAHLISRYRNAQEGGIVLLLSSGANQTSAALGNFSAYTHALTEGLRGKADFNGDGEISLEEANAYAIERTRTLCKNAHVQTQDGEAAWSPSMAKGLILAGRRFHD